jgi:hypothetical protein
MATSKGCKKRDCQNSLWGGYRRKEEKEDVKKKVDGRCTSSHENKTFRSRSVVKQKGMVFGFRKTATAVTRPERYIYRMSQEECAKLRESVPYVKVYRYNPKYLYPKLNGYGDNSQRKMGASCGSKYCNPHS